MDVAEWERLSLIKTYGAIPDQCPTCHGTRIVRIVWKPACYRGGPLGSAIRDGHAILAGGDRPEGAPGWVCPSCQPGWEAVYLLVQEEDGWQDKIEQAIGEDEFAAARRHRDSKYAVRQRRQVLVTQLLAAGSAAT